MFFRGRIDTITTDRENLSQDEIISLVSTTEFVGVYCNFFLFFACVVETEFHFV